MDIPNIEVVAKHLRAVHDESVEAQIDPLENIGRLSHYCQDEVTEVIWTALLNMVQSLPPELRVAAVQELYPSLEDVLEMGSPDEED